jgi:hypothetical protein
VIVSVPDGVNNPFGHEFELYFKDKRYTLYFSAAKPYRIVDYFEQPNLPVVPDMSDPAKAILGTWKQIAADGYWGNEKLFYFPDDWSEYVTIEFFRNGSYRTYFIRPYPNGKSLFRVGTYYINQEFLRQEFVNPHDYHISPSEGDEYEGCYKYSFFEEDKLKLERCVPYPQSDWYEVLGMKNK